MNTVALYEDPEGEVSATVMFQGNRVMVVSGKYGSLMGVAMRCDLSQWNQFKKHFRLEQKTVLHLSENPSNEEIKKALDMAESQLHPRGEFKQEQKHQDDPAKWNSY